MTVERPTANRIDATERRRELWARILELFRTNRPSDEQLTQVSTLAEVAIDQVFGAHRLSAAQREERHAGVKDYAECAALYGYVLGYAATDARGRAPIGRGAPDMDVVLAWHGPRERSIDLDAGEAVSPYQEGLVGRMERRARAQQELSDSDAEASLSHESPALATDAQDAPGHDARARLSQAGSWGDETAASVDVAALREELVEIALLTAQQHALGEHVTTRLERVERLFGWVS